MSEREWVVTPEIIMNAYRYDEEEIPFIEILLKSAEGVLKGAGAWHPTNDITPAVISLMVGFWLENREGMTNDNRSIESLPFGITAMINQLRFRSEQSEGD